MKYYPLIFTGLLLIYTVMITFEKSHSRLIYGMHNIYSVNSIICTRPTPENILHRQSLQRSVSCRKSVDKSQLTRIIQAHTLNINELRKKVFT